MAKRSEVIDTCVLIESINHVNGTASDAAQAERAFEYLRTLQEEQVQVIVPSVVVAELLTPMDDAQAEAAWQHLKDNFIVAPFDGKAAVLSAQAMRTAIANRKGRPTPPPSRHEAKVDGMIVGVAMSQKAQQIVSYNLDDFRRAGSPVPVVEPPAQAKTQRIDFGAVN